MSIEALREKRGLIATVVLSDIKHQFSQSLSDMRDWNSRNGFVNIEYKMFDAKLVESGRDAVCEHALAAGYDWLMMIDADAAGFPAMATLRMLESAYVTHPQAHVIGAYSQLKQPPYLPTIDTGTGRWEVHYPGQGLLEVIRTGGHFLFIKTPLLRHMGRPWFRTRIPLTPAKAMKELDNFARITLDGKNPLRLHPEWETLYQAARKTSAATDAGSASVGEDSGFCDNARAHGGVIYVDTDLVTSHIGSKAIVPSDLRKEMKELEKRLHAAVGVRDYE